MPRAGLDAASVTEAGAALADEQGLDGLSMALLAERLGVRTPSLYKHVANQADLVHRIGVQAMTEIGDVLQTAIQGRSGGEALVAAAEAMRAYAKLHPGRYAAANAGRPADDADPLAVAGDRVLTSLAASLRGYDLTDDEVIHALRMLRSLVHGFVTLESAGGFMIATDVEDSFTWMVALLHRGLDGP